MKITITDEELLRSECPHFFEDGKLNEVKLKLNVEAIIEIGLNPQIKGVKVIK